jgi:hypothetical protein
MLEAAAQASVTGEPQSFNYFGLPVLPGFDHKILQQTISNRQPGFCFMRL